MEANSCSRLADSYARAGYLTVIPDLFAGDAIPSDIPESQLNLTAWFPNHQPANVEPVIEKTIAYLRDDLGIQTIGAVGYCFGGRYVARFLAEGKGVDLGFTAHPSVLSNAEIAQIVNPISIAAGGECALAVACVVSRLTRWLELDATFNITQRYDADRLLTGNNVTYEQTLYSGAPHGFGVRVNANIPRQKYAKQSAYIQALKWFDFWL
jgi:dienelactone hydrolase